MEKGLDELIEYLLTEIAFSGSRGCSDQDFLKAICAFYGSNASGSGPSKNNAEPTSISNVAQEERGHGANDGVVNDTSGHDLGLASKVWGWLVARNDVSVGTNREFNYLTLEDYLRLCERERATQSTLDSEATPGQEAHSSASGPRPGTDNAPRLYVSEQRQWKALAGHGPDLKRIPLFEWKALVDIASVKEQGILQGDLVRLTGQDKRSLPTRTDALARKGYIIKQPILLRGFRSSKLWLKQYAESAQAEAKREGLPLEELDLSKEVLMKDLNPVSFTEYWNGDRLDYLAIAQGFIAITKAWGIIRYCDLRAKMGIEERIPQMRALAKSSRWFTKLGAVTFVAARFANSNRLFKDCVKFLREPTPSEWKRFRSIPSRHIKAPSSRLGKRGQASREHAKLKATQAKAGESNEQAKAPPAKSIAELSDQMVVTSASWMPQKPFVNTVFDVIRRAGPEGTSNNEVRHLTLGHSYRKFIASTNASLASPLVQAVQPEYQVTSQLSRIGKIMTYQFFAPGSTGTGSQEDAADKTRDQQADQAEATSVTLAKPSQEFSQPSSKFVANSSMSLSDLCKKAPSSTKSGMTTALAGYQSGRSSRKKVSKRPRGRPPKGQREANSQEASQTEPGVEDVISHTIDDQITSAPGRLKRQRGNTGDADVPADDLPEHLDIQSSTEDTTAIDGGNRRLALPDAPGVYRGVPNSLSPYKRHGRPPKSIVLIFKSEKLKDPGLLGATVAKASGTGVVGEDPDQPPNAAVPASSTPGSKADDASSALHKKDQSPSDAVVSKRGARPGSKTKFKCDKCGRTWKNSNGLEYHKSKSQTPCNPAFAEAPPRPKPLPAPFQARKVRQDRVILATPSRRQARRSIDGTFKNSRERPSPKHVVQDRDTDTSIVGTPQKLEDRGRSLLLQDVEVYNVASRQRGRSPSASGPASDTTSHSLQQYQLASQEASGMRNGSSNHNEQRHESASQPSNTASKPQPPPSERPQKRGRESSSDPNHSYEDASSDLPQKRQKVSSDDAGKPANGKQLEQQPLVAGPDDSTVEMPILTVPGSIASPTSVTGTSNVDFSLQPTSKPHTSDTAAQQENTTVNPTLRQPSALPDETATGPPVTLSKGNSQGKITKVKGVSALVQNLLSDNNGVFPGDLSLLIVVASLWDKEFPDSKTPDRRTIQFAVNKLESQGQVKRLHFLFLDEKGDSQKISVVVSVSPGKSGAEELAMDPRVLKVKDKIREAHPNIYIPENIVMSTEDLEKYRLLMLKPKEKPKKNVEPSPREVPEAQPLPEHEIEMMHYRRPALGDNSIPGVVIPPSTPDRSRDEAPVAATDALPISGSKSVKSRGARKGQKKTLTYVWGRNHKPVSTWNQKPSCLQDATTGAWSTPPQALNSQASLDNILSIVRYGRIVQPKAPGRKRKHSGSTASPRKRMFARDTNKPREDDAMVDSDHSTPMPSKTGDSFRDGWTAGAFDHSEADSEDEPPDEVAGKLNVTVTKEVVPAEGTQDKVTVPNVQTTGTPGSGQGNGPVFPNQFRFILGTQPVTNDSLQTARFLHRENLPQSVDDIASVPRRGRIKPNKWVDKPLAEFTQRVNAISHWELSADGSRVISSKPVTPGSIFLDVTVDQSKANMQPLALQWSPETQYTIDNLPEEIKNEVYDDQDAGLSEADKGNDQSTKTRRKRKDKTYQDDEIESHYIVNRAANKEPCAYTTRNLTALPPSQQGRVSKRRPLNDLVGRLGDTAIIAAIIVIKSLLGGVEGTVDYGLLLKLFPEKSFTRLKSFWPKACKQRKKFVDALTDKFQTSFLEAYEKGEIAPIDYDNLEDYDWVSLILWTAKLDTHDEIDLPSSRTELEKMYVLEDPEDEVIDWRQTWFDNVAVHVRVEANISRPATIPVSKSRDDDTLMLRARSWIRSLCNTEMSEAGVPHKVLEKLLELGKGDEEETTRIISTVVDSLIRDRIATKGKSKKFGFRLNFNFDRIVDKAANTEKYTQAVAFKSRLDDAFRADGEMFLPYAADDGSIMAVINMQSHGRIHLEPVDVPDIPFGFEPLNYESRSYPKSYYHWKVKLLPTETYLYDDDMPLLEQVRRAQIPARGPHGTIPIWVDLLDRVDRRRWVEYVCMMAFALATKGPMTPRSASAILKPVLEPFEARLIMDFLDHLGLLQPSFPGVPGGDGGSAGEWWWLAVGKMVDVKGKAVEVATKGTSD